MKNVFTLTAVALALALPLAAQATQAEKPKPKAKPAAKAEAGPPKATDTQLAAADAADFGTYRCDMGEVVSIERHPKHTGYINVAHRKQSYLMKPVISSTGAVRLEDLKGQMLMVQIATKSMLMDTKRGQRVVDGCQSEAQRNAAPTTASSLGIAPDAGAAAAPAPQR